MRYQYRWHTGYPGGLKEMNPQTLRQHKPEEVLTSFSSFISMRI
jgi:hypothetical protein